MHITFVRHFPGLGMSQYSAVSVHESGDEGPFCNLHAHAISDVQPRRAVFLPARTWVLGAAVAVSIVVGTLTVVVASTFATLVDAAALNHPPVGSAAALSPPGSPARGAFPPPEPPASPSLIAASVSTSRAAARSPPPPEPPPTLADDLEACIDTLADSLAAAAPQWADTCRSANERLGLEADLIEQAVRPLLAHHDSLRAASW